MIVEYMETIGKVLIFCFLVAPRLKERQTCVDNSGITWEVL